MNAANDINNWGRYRKGKEMERKKWGQEWEKENLNKKMMFVSRNPKRNYDKWGNNMQRRKYDRRGRGKKKKIGQG